MPLSLGQGETLEMTILPSCDRVPTTVIVGAGQAGSECATALRQNGYAGRIVMIGDEPHPPYRRPPLSKAFLVGDVAVESMYLKPSAAYERARIECVFGLYAISIDPTAKQVVLSDGSRIAY